MLATASRSVRHSEETKLLRGDVVIISSPWGHDPQRRPGMEQTFQTKVGIPNFVSGPREYIMEGEYVILAMCSWFRIR